MLTARGSMLVLIAAIGLLAGLLASNQQVAIGSLALVMWITLYWIAILWLASRQPILANAVRHIAGQSATDIVLTIDQTARIQVAWQMPFDWAGMRFHIRDVFPDTFWETDGQSNIYERSRLGRKINLEYQVRPAACGHFELPGLAVQINDWTGLFHLQRFVPCRQAVTVLPWMIRPQTTAPVVKPQNVQSVPGHHAYRRAGISAELLGIRDYQPGDPPRTIAWKATARTGKLMSREFEMEVPVRATLICGLTHWQYAARPATSVADRVITAAATIARLLLADRDPVALMLASEKGSSRLGHGSGGRHLVRLLHQLLDATTRLGSVEPLRGNDLFDAVLESAWCRFPELFDLRFNSLPALKLRLLPERRRRSATRRRLALLLSHLLELPPGSEFRLACDPVALESACHRYAHLYPVQQRPPASTGSRGSIDEQLALVHHLSSCLLQAHSRARDNELFVVIGEISGGRVIHQELIDTIRVCRAARHRVIAIDTPAAARSTPWLDEAASRILAQDTGPDEVTETSELQTELTRLGVRYAQLQDPRLMQIVINELELIQTGRARSGNQRSFAH